MGWISTALILFMTPGLAFFYGGLRVTPEDEQLGLDRSQHAESAYTT